MVTKVVFKGQTKEFAGAITAHDAMKELRFDGLKVAVAVKVNGEVRDLHRALPAGAVDLEAVSPESTEGLEVIRHSAAHLMATAFKRLLPDTKFAHGPATEDGFFYDFAAPRPITEEDLPVIEKEMKKIVKEDARFERTEMPVPQALQWAQREGGPFKRHYLQNEKNSTVSFYKDADFVDLCTGPHVPSSRWLRAFKLLKITGAYWLGDSKNQMLTRVYGTAFDTEERLQEWVRMREEAEKRKHTRLGKDLDLFSTHQEVGAGLIHWHPNAGRVRYLIERYWYDLHLQNGYNLVYTPHLVSEELYRISGHLEVFSDSMYGALLIDEKPFRVKPMNCPGHIMIYKTGVRSYRDLPLRYAEMGTVYRYEASGVLHGLTRVRGFTIDDAHIFVAPDQVEGELERVYRLGMEFLRPFQFKEVGVVLSTRPAKAIGRDEDWERATQALKNVLERLGQKYELDEGGGAFYGPKISLNIKDSLGRSWQCSTFQFDFNLPERFDLKFVGEDNQAHRPYMVHRALMGSVERFFGVLVEHYGGEFPLWLAPFQVAVFSVTEKEVEYARKVADRLRAEGLRVQLDDGNDRIAYKIRAATLQKVPFMLIVGAREATAGSVAVRERREGDLGPMQLESVVSTLKEKSRIP
ncbi:MAG TPA: threonine--tRNA ligase [Planctomycetota bacterium]|nr:threonine--tRNA ligase [Planctomycetota bacterium]